MHSLTTRAAKNEIEKFEMCKLKKFLSIIVIILNCVVVIEVGYFCWFIAKNRESFSMENLLITLFINFSMLFFAVAVIVGVLQSNPAMLFTWIVYATIEISRSSIVLYDSWAHQSDKIYERIFNSCDVGVQALSIIVVSVLLQVIKLQDEPRSKITSNFLELNKVTSDRNKRVVTS